MKIPIGLALAGLLLTGCGMDGREDVDEFAENTSAVEPSAPEPEPDDIFGAEEDVLTPEDITGTTPNEIFVSFLRLSHPETFGRVPDFNITGMGQGVCNLLDDRVSVETIFQASLNSGYTVEEVVTIIRASVDVYCPEYQEVIG